eukprot:bmy_17186T0
MASDPGFPLSLGSHLCYPGSFYSSNLVYSTDLYSLSTCQLGSSLYSSCQETCYELTMCQAFSVVQQRLLPELWIQKLLHTGLWIQWLQTPGL